MALAGQGLPLRLYRTAKIANEGEHLVQLLMFLKFLYAKQSSLNLGRWQWDKN